MNTVENDNNETEQSRPVLTMTELMKRWKCARKTILEAHSKGRLKLFKVGDRCYRISMEEVLRYERENHGVKAA
jgi:hypothetical protein